MRTSILLVLGCLVTGLSIPTPAFGWGRTGHRVVGDIAETYLSDEARAEIRKLLGDETLAAVSTWADGIKRERPETRPLHYINVPQGATNVDLSRDCTDGAL